jgi:peptide/nickel transport system permease protein
MRVCALCRKEIEDPDESLYCGHCHAVFHRSCLMEHFYYNRFCPACREKLSFIDMHFGFPPEPPRPLPEPPGYTQYKELIDPQEVFSGQVDHWLPRKEIPLFDSRPIIRTYQKKGFFEKVREFITAEPEKVAGSTLGRFRHNGKAKMGVLMLFGAVVIALFAPHLILHDPVSFLVEDPELVNHPPTLEFPFGTDVFGRDIYSQVIWGFRSALKMGIPSALLVGVIGTVVGLVSGYYGKYVDAVLQRISLTFLVWPSIPLIALIVFSWGGFQAQLAVTLGVSFTLWPTTARAIRAEVMSLKTRPFIEAAKVSGTTSRRIIFKHILPNVIHLTFLYMTIAVASALMLEATFNFLGLTSPAEITWGSILSFTYHSATARFGVGGLYSWWTVIPAGMAIAYMVLSFFLISTGLRESMRITSLRF